MELLSMADCDMKIAQALIHTDVGGKFNYKPFLLLPWKFFLTLRWNVVQSWLYNEDSKIIHIYLYYIDRKLQVAGVERDA